MPRQCFSSSIKLPQTPETLELQVAQTFKTNLKNMEPDTATGLFLVSWGPLPSLLATFFVIMLWLCSWPELILLHTSLHSPVSS